MSMLSSVSSRGPAVVDETDENTKRWYTDPQLLLTERLKAESERSDLRPRPSLTPPASPSSVPPQAIDVQRVRGLYEQFVRLIGPAAKLLFESELRQLQLRPSSMTERDYAALVLRLMQRIPDPNARDQFKAQALIETWP